MPKRTSSAWVMLGARRSELREFPLPAVRPDAGLLRIEAAGVCGSDVAVYNRDASPRILGHENVGTIAELGEQAAKRWGVSEGDRVVLEEYLPCGHCAHCRSGAFRFCPESDWRRNPAALRYGATPLTVEPGLWGGLSEYLYLHPNVVMHRLGPDVPATRASLAIPLSNGYEWAYLAGQVRPGDVVVVLGPGQHGLGCVIAAKQAGAGLIVVVGLARDAGRLDIAAKLGADGCLYAEDPGLPDKVRELTGGEMADLVVDTAVGNEQTVGMTLELTRRRGRIVAAAGAGRPLSEIDYDQLARKSLSLRGVRGHSYAAVEWAIDVISRGQVDLDLMSSLEVGLEDAEKAILGTAGELDQPVIHAAVVPAP